VGKCIGVNASGVLKPNKARVDMTSFCWIRWISMSVRIDISTWCSNFQYVRLHDRIRVWRDQLTGTWDYWRRPEWRLGWGGPFNGQEFRQRLFTELCTRVPFSAIIETGTYRGTTTEYFRRATRVPIHSFETDPRNYGFARARLMFCPNVHLHRCDSRAGLVHLATSNAVPTDAVFFYLDAHGSADLPLAQEIALAFTHWPEAVVMIDDFAVPDDPGYGFDDWGPGKALTLGYLGESAVLPLGVWFPACASTTETGFRRGCVVLARATDLIRRIDTVRTLRRWAHDEARTLAPEP